MTLTLQRRRQVAVRCINRQAVVHQVPEARKSIFKMPISKSNETNFWGKSQKLCLLIRSPRSLSPAHHVGGCYDDIDDYSPVVSDIEDQNDEDSDLKVKSKRKDDLDKDNNDILQKILNEQSTSKCELEEENGSDQGEHDDIDEIKESMLKSIWITPPTVW